MSQTGPDKNEKKFQGRGVEMCEEKKTFIIYKLIKCSNPNTPLP